MERHLPVHGNPGMNEEMRVLDRRNPAGNSGQGGGDPKVSVVIVCMNNLENLRRCLGSLKACTSIPFEALVVAYLFKPENLAAARAEFPWARFVESNEIRGFSENNNLALREARGEYCFVLNDDTELRMDAIGKLVAAMEQLPTDAAIVSPKILWPDGRTQVCGVPYKDWRHIVLKFFHLWKESMGKGVGGTGLFRSYNICGAAFLIRTDVFRALGWFDERFFFCPEDIALSTAANRAGHSVWVDADAEVVHDGGMSGKSISPVLAAARAAAAVGTLWFYGDTCGRRMVLRAVSLAGYGLKWIYHVVRGGLRPRPNVDWALAAGDWCAVRACLGRKSPKEVFLANYKRIQQREKQHGRRQGNPETA